VKGGGVVDHVEANVNKTSILFANFQWQSYPGTANRLTEVSSKVNTPWTSTWGCKTLQISGVVE